jgi:hypothetical protein
VVLVVVLYVVCKLIFVFFLKILLWVIIIVIISGTTIGPLVMVYFGCTLGLIPLIRALMHFYYKRFN